MPASTISEEPGTKTPATGTASAKPKSRTIQ
jgi:hypothetical protein